MFLLRSMFLPNVSLEGKKMKNLAHKFNYIQVMHYLYWPASVMIISRFYIIYTMYNYFVIYLFINLNLQINRDALYIFTASLILFKCSKKKKKTHNR